MNNAQEIKLGSMKLEYQSSQNKSGQGQNQTVNHYFQIFCNYRFYDSHRKHLALKARQDAQEMERRLLELAQMGSKSDIHRSSVMLKGISIDANGNITANGGGLGNLNGVSDLTKGKNGDEEIRENNIIVASWINDLGNQQKEFDDKILFFNNETLLNRQILLDHFSKENKKYFYDKNIEFCCKKGKMHSQNQDNFFCVADGDLKIFGVFDGHGIYGHIISGFAAGVMLDYIRNKNKIFNIKNLEKETDKNVTAALRRCFKYAQEQLKQRYQQIKNEEREEKRKVKQDKRQNQKLEMDDEDSKSELIYKNKNKDQVDKYRQQQTSSPNNNNNFNDENEDLFMDSDENSEDLCSESSWETSSDYDENDDKEFFKYQAQNLHDNSGILSDENNLKDEKNEAKEYQRQKQDEEQKLIGALSLSKLMPSSKQHGPSNETEGGFLKPIVSSNNNELRSSETMRSRKIFRINQKGLNIAGNPLKEIQEKSLREKLKSGSGSMKGFDIALSGTSATIVIQTPKKLYVAWVGDSQVALGNIDKKLNPIKLTFPEHTPADEVEKIRIYNHRGEVRSSVLEKKTRIYVRARMYPGLSTSRSLGDVLAHQIGVTSEPNIKNSFFIQQYVQITHNQFKRHALYFYLKILNITQNDKFIALGSDGIWDNIGYEDVLEIVNEYGLRDPGMSSEYICSKVKDICVSDNSLLDDMTLIVSHLQINKTLH